MKENLEREIWKPVVGYEGLYEVSNMGRVRSFDRVVEYSNGRKCYHKGKILNGWYQKGYQSYSLYNNGNKVTKKAHQLVAMAFLGHKPDGNNIVVDHISNDKSNNRLDNLQVITNRENKSKDKVGLSKFTGVCWHKKSSKWFVRIGIGYERIYLGCFDNEEEAGSTYQLALKHIDKYDGNPKEFRQYLNSI